ncbi:hypothetical protein A3F19_00330 [Candidatus Nomurabacteria bacterium RIFCSPHIGHO2_12_FULL_37_29]|uniref:Uncharacterized protein n=2 Tax=Parcubacteria group TaxID=1794811 RepID=A0A1G2UQ65_9BACT|nr:MAG: hypothetical protein A3F19_00330 [Candidatus Nomurabacteria bacterium RIFCSPHIGHO2_12_FULL_37_29]OHB11536.1 MAG: hypothetical protein A3H60_01485 [Candidatus Zambryskibacteria bacterium RIFCSPLOWO2_02_FULL_44_12b]
MSNPFFEQFRGYAVDEVCTASYLLFNPWYERYPAITTATQLAHIGTTKLLIVAGQLLRILNK